MATTKPKYLFDRWAMKHQFLILFILLFGWASQAQIARVYTVDDGLAQGYVTALAQDGLGFIWIGTQNGLSRFDGFSFKTYRATEAAHSIGFNKIEQLITAPNGQVWVSNGKQIQRYNHYNNRFESVSGFSLSSTERLVTMAFDNEGQLWICKNTGVLCLKIKENDTSLAATVALEIALGGKGQPQARTLAVTEGQVVVGTTDGLYRLDATLGQMTKVEGCPLQSLAKIWPDNQNGGLWIHNKQGSALWKDHQFRFFPQLTSAHLLKKQHTAVGSNRPTYIVAPNSIWTWNGIGLEKAFSSDTYEFVVSLTDRQGNLWLGTNTKGLVLYQNTQRLIHSFAVGETLSSLVSKDREGNHLFFKGNQCGHLLSANSGYRMPVSQYGIDENGDKWVLTCNNELIHATHRENGAVLKLKKEDEVYKLKCLPAKVLLLAKSDGVWLKKTTSGEEIHLDLGPINKKLRRTNTIKSSPDGQAYWIGMDEGLICIVPDWQNLTATYQFFRSGTELPDLEVLSLEFIVNGEHRMLLGTLNGLLEYEPKLGKYTRFSTDLISVHDVAYCMQRDQSNRIWLGTNSGLKMYDPQTLKSQWFTTPDGLPASEFNRNTAFLAPDGEVFMGTVSGAVHFYPETLLTHSVQAEIVLTDAVLNDTAIWKAGLQQIQYAEGDRLSIHFNLLDFTPNALRRFQYRLVGTGEDWQPTDNRVLHLPYLSAGKYLFEVRGSNGKMEWSQPVRVALTVSLAFWKKMVLGIVLLLVFVFGAIGLYYRRNLYTAKPQQAAPPPTTDETTPPTQGLIESDVIFPQVSALIEQHFKDCDFKATDIQQMLRISKAQLYRKMLDETGNSAAYFLKKRRMEEAAHLLRNQPQMSISEIAYAAGFSDPNYFSTAFSATFGQSPRNYRQCL